MLAMVVEVRRGPALAGSDGRNITRNGLSIEWKWHREVGYWTANAFQLSPHERFQTARKIITLIFRCPHAEATGEAG